MKEIKTKVDLDDYTNQLNQKANKAEIEMIIRQIKSIHK
jgi:hypothetical protein